MSQVTKRRVPGPAWRPGDPVLTVGEIAARIAAIAPDTEATIQRIRHWTREQLLLPVDFYHAGTGKHRRYAETAVYDVALLHVLTSAGFTVSAMRYLVDALTQTRFSVPEWLRGGGQEPLRLYISRSATGRTETGMQPPKEPADLTIVVDLAMLVSRIGGAPEANV